MKFRINLFAHAGVVSPDPEVASVQVEATSVQEAERVAQLILAAEQDSNETYVTWYSSPGYEPTKFIFGMGVESVEPSDDQYESDYLATDIIKERSS